MAHANASLAQSAATEYMLAVLVPKVGRHPSVSQVLTRTGSAIRWQRNAQPSSEDTWNTHWATRVQLPLALSPWPHSACGWAGSRGSRLCALVAG